jgi:hypothetical protein
MALDPRKRQKKVERKKAKDKARHKALAVRQSKAVAHRFDRAGHGRILDCFVTGPLWDEGMGNVVLTREAGAGHVAFAAFLVDVYCLGVKDVVFDILSHEGFRNARKRFLSQSPLERHPPEYVRKLVEDAVEYARSIGLEPHADYQQAKAIFGDIDASACREEFEFGREGKPFFISGPTDTPAGCIRVLRALTERCGEGNFDSLLQLSDRDKLAAGILRFAKPQYELADECAGNDDSDDDEGEGEPSAGADHGGEPTDVHRAAGESVADVSRGSE